MAGDGKSKEARVLFGLPSSPEPLADEGASPLRLSLSPSPSPSSSTEESSDSEDDDQPITHLEENSSLA